MYYSKFEQKFLFDCLFYIVIQLFTTLFFFIVWLINLIKFTPLIIICFLALSGCSVFGNVSVDIIPYETVEKNEFFEVRRYERLVFVSTSMSEGLDSAYGPFRKLFDYISGNNENTEKIAMTAPVLLNQLEQTTETMSFVLPKNFSLPMTPRPKNPNVKLSEIRNFTVAVASFSGLLNQNSIAINQAKLKSWILKRGFKITGEPKAAGYNPPFTLPFFRRNEILIPIE